MMFCCCASNDSSSYTLADKEGEKAAHVQTGKGPINSSNQNLGPEASLDKGTILSTQSDRNPISEQPIHSSSAGVTNQSHPLPEHPKSESQTVEKSLDVSEIEAQIIKPASNTVTESKPIEKPVYISTVNVKGSTDIAHDSFTQRLAPIQSQLVSLEQAITDVESKSALVGKSAVPDLASQLKVLNTQVLEVTSGSGNKMADKNLGDVVSRLESVATRLESLAAGKAVGGASSGDEVAEYVITYDAFLSGPVAQFVSLSNAIGGEIKTQADMVKEAFDAQREFLNMASKSKQPDQGKLQEILKPLATKLLAVQDFREKQRGSAFFNHLSTISESISALAWVTITPAPGPYVKELAEAGTFFKNRITQIKDKDPQHVAWGKSWVAIFPELQAYIKSYHTTGVSWNPQGVDAKVAMSGSNAAAPPPPAGGPPPPPPPAPAAPDGPADGANAGPDKAALFASINKGENVTQGLKKVTDNMKTHKNPALRQGPAPFKSKPSPKPSPTPVAKAPAATAKKPVMELLQGKKWVIEHFKDDKNIVLTDTEMRHTVYIYNCDGCVIQIKGKVNSITMDSCKKTGIVFEDALSSCEFVNCKSVQGQVTGKVGTLSIDKTDGCCMYLSKDALDVEIVAAKSSEMNISIPQADGDFKEFALPEQFKTVYNKSTGTIETCATDI